MARNFDDVLADDWEDLNKAEGTGGYEPPETEAEAQSSYERCPECGANNLSNAKVCHYCGYSCNGL